MNKEDLGSYFIKNGELYYCDAYSERPTIQLKNMRNGQNVSIVVGSRYSEEFSKLLSVKAKADGYDLDSATPVERIEGLGE